MLLLFLIQVLIDQLDKHVVLHAFGTLAPGEHIVDHVVEDLRIHIFVTGHYRVLDLFQLQHSLRFEVHVVELVDQIAPLSAEVVHEHPREHVLVRSLLVVCLVLLVHVQEVVPDGVVEDLNHLLLGRLCVFIVDDLYLVLRLHEVTSE